MQYFLTLKIKLQILLRKYKVKGLTKHLRSLLCLVLVLLLYEVLCESLIQLRYFVMGILLQNNSHLH